MFPLERSTLGCNPQSHLHVHMLSIQPHGCFAGGSAMAYNFRFGGTHVGCIGETSVPITSQSGKRSAKSLKQGEGQNTNLPNNIVALLGFGESLTLPKSLHGSIRLALDGWRLARKIPRTGSSPNIKNFLGGPLLSVN